MNASKRYMLTTFNWIARLGLGCLFIYGSLPKIRQPYDFLRDVYRYELVGPKLGLFVAMTLPWLELFVGICLVVGILVSGALLFCMAMSAMFTCAIGWALYLGLDISCGCFGSGIAKITYMTLVRAMVIGVFSFLAFLNAVFLQVCIVRNAHSIQ